MNILFLTFAYLPSTGGVQRTVSILARELQARGHHVTVAADRIYSERSALGLQRDQPADVLVMNIPVPSQWGARPKMTWAVDFYNVLRLVALSLRRRIDLVHCHLINVDTRYGAMLRRILGIPMMLTLHGDELTKWIKDQPHRKQYVIAILRAADAINILNTEQLESAQALAPGIEASIERISNPADLEGMSKAMDESVPLPAKPYLLFSGRFVDFKSLDVLIQAYHDLVADNPRYPADLILAGGGELADSLRSQASQGAAAGRIHFRGEVGWGESLRLIQNASFLILASHESEGCPNVLLEAMALGTPVIVSDNPNLLATVSPEINGEVFRRRDPASLKTCLQAARFDAERRADYAREGRSFVEKHHRTSEIIAAYERTYERLMTRRTGSAAAGG